MNELENKKNKLFCLDDWLKSDNDGASSRSLLQSYRDNGLNNIWPSVQEYVEEGQ